MGELAGWNLIAFVCSLLRAPALSVGSGILSSQ